MSEYNRTPMIERIDEEAKKKKKSKTGKLITGTIAAIGAGLAIAKGADQMSKYVDFQAEPSSKTVKQAAENVERLKEQNRIDEITRQLSENNLKEHEEEEPEHREIKD